MRFLITMLASSLFFVGCPQAEAKPKPKPVNASVQIKDVKLTKKQLERMKKALIKVYKKRYGELPSN